MGRVCIVRYFVAELVMGRIGYGPSLLWAEFFMCGTVSSMLSGLKTRSLGLNTLGTT